MEMINEYESHRDEATSPALPARLGSYYETVVPDTLDLAERARLGIHHFTSIISEERGYEMPLTGDFDQFRLPTVTFHMNALGACQCKAMETMAMLRVMSGSQQNLAREAKMVEMMASLLGDDGLHWVPGGRADKPWITIPEPFVMVHGQGRIVRAMIAWYQYTGDSIWKDRIDRLVDGLDRVMVVHKDDYAYFPVYGHYEAEYLRSCYTRKGWKDTVEPTNEKFGEEGSLFNHQGHIPGALATWYRLTGNEQALRLSGELVRFLTKPTFWADWSGGEYPDVVGSDHAHWQGHFHGYINTLRAILDYAIATSDPRLQAFVRDGYEWARQPMLARIGYVGDGQGCGCGRLIGLAVKLTYAGVGDYWEDVDQYIRNHGTEMQFTPEDIPYLPSLGEGKPELPQDPGLSTVGVMEAAPGGFAGRTKARFWLCCSPHGSMGLFYAWDGGLRYADGVAQVNLLLNRASPWMDVDSYLPYEGKVVLRNKTCREVFVRIPLWIEKGSVGSHVGGTIVQLEWFGRYVRIGSLKADDVVTIEFPVGERTERWTVGPTDYTCRFKGNTLVKVSPSIPPGTWLYHDRVEKHRAAEAPMKEVTRFVTPFVLTW